MLVASYADRVDRRGIAPEPRLVVAPESKSADSRRCPVSEPRRFGAGRPLPLPSNPSDANPRLRGGGISRARLGIEPARPTGPVSWIPDARGLSGERRLRRSRLRSRRHFTAHVGISMLGRSHRGPAGDQRCTIHALNHPDEARNRRRSVRLRSLIAMRPIKPVAGSHQSLGGRLMHSLKPRRGFA